MSIFAFIIGACLGSFANATMTRLNALSLWSRSKCLSCGTAIYNRDNIPIVSYILRMGRCRHCHSRYSSRYLWVELLMGLVGLIVWDKSYVIGAPMYMSIISYALYMSLFTILLAISLYDIKHKIVPTQLSSALIINGLLLILWRLYGGNNQFGLMANTIEHNAFIELLGGVLTALPYATLFIFSRGRWVGFGDVLVYLGVGWGLGLVAGLYTFLYSVWVAGLFTLVWYMTSATRKGFMKIEIPFAPFIAIAALLAYTYSMDILGIHNVLLYGF